VKNEDRRPTTFYETHDLLLNSKFEYIINILEEEEVECDVFCCVWIRIYERGGSQ